MPMTDREIDEVLARYGRGVIDEQAAARELRGEVEQARRDKAERDPNDPDAGSTPNFWSHLAEAAAPWRKLITPEQYQQLGKALG